MAAETEIERMVIRLVGDGSLYRQMMTQAASTTASVATSIQKNSSTIQSFTKTIQGYANKALQSIDRLKSKMSQIGTMGLGAVGAGMLPQLAGAAGVVGTVAGFGWAISLASQAEDAQVSFETMLQSASAAKKMLADLTKFAADTPFEMPQLRNATQMLLQYGVAQDRVMPMLKSLGDIAQGDNQKLHGLAYAMAQVKSMGRLMGQEKNQMVGWGFNPLEAVSQMTGKGMPEVFKMMEQGKITFELLEKAMAHATGPTGRFFNAMEKKSKMTSGLMSTLADTIKIEVTKIGEVMIDKLDIKGFLKSTIDIAGKVGPALSGAFGTVMDWIIPKLKATIGFIGSAISTLAPIVQMGVNWIKSGLESVVAVFLKMQKAVGPIGPYFETAKSFMVDFGIAALQWVQENQDFLATLAFIAATVGTIFAGFAAGPPILAAVAAAFALIMNPITLAIGGITALTYYFVKYTETGKWAAGQIQGAFAFMADQFNLLVDLIKAGEFAIAWRVITTSVVVVWASTIAWLYSSWIKIKSFMSLAWIGLMKILSVSFDQMVLAVKVGLNYLIDKFNNLVPSYMELPRLDDTASRKALEETKKFYRDTEDEIVADTNRQLKDANAPAEAAKKAWIDAQKEAKQAVEERKKIEANAKGKTWVGMALDLGGLAMEQVQAITAPAVATATEVGKSVGTAYTAGVKSELKSLDAIEATANNAYNVLEAFRSKFNVSQNQTVTQSTTMKPEEPVTLQTIATGIGELVAQGRAKVGQVMEIGLASLSGS